MSESLTAQQVLDREFLEIRAKILEIGSSLDRIGRATGSVDEDRRMQLLHRGIEILGTNSKCRAEQIQLLFSRQYEDDWRENMDVKPRY